MAPMTTPSTSGRASHGGGRKSSELQTLQSRLQASSGSIAGNAREAGAIGGALGVRAASQPAMGGDALATIGASSASALHRSASFDLQRYDSAGQRDALPAGVDAQTYHYDPHGAVSFPDALEHFRDRARRCGDADVQLAFVSFLLDAAHKIVHAPMELGLIGGASAAARASEPTEEQRGAMARVMEGEALRWLKKLAAGGRGGALPEAQFMLAEKYGKGMLDLPVDHAKAFALYMQASKANHAVASYRVAVSYEVGAGTKLDLPRAVQFYRKAAALGDALAMHKVALVLLYGKLGQKQALKEGLVWLKRAANAADARHPEALHDLAQCYERRGGCPVVIPDEDYALELYARAAQFGFAPSQYRLGSAYEYGLLGVSVDAAASIKWYSRAAEQGFPEAELALSSWYLSGAQGVLQQSDTDAYLWARKAADRRCVKAEYQVGNYFEIGIGVDADVDEAKRWYARAAAKGHKRAQQRLAELRKTGRKSARRCVVA